MSRLKIAGQVGAVGLVIALLGLLVWKVVQEDRTNVARSFTKGQRTEPVDFELNRLNGEGSLQLSSLRGKVIVLNFWAAWCDPCKREAPLFQEASERYKDRVVFVGVDTADFSGDARAFLARYGVTYPNVRDPNTQVLDDYGGLPLPRTYVIDRTWTVSGYIYGETREENLRSAIEEALGHMRWALCLLAALALCAAPGALASEDDPTSFEVQNELWCTDCDTTLADASAVSYTPAAISYIEQLIANGEKKSVIKERLAERYLGHLLVMPSKTVGERPTLADLEDEVICPACNTTLDQSSSSAARRVEAFIVRRIEAGDSKQQIKDRLVADYGPWILAAPPKEGFDLLAWLLPLVGLVGGALVLAALAWHWTRRRGPPAGSPALSPALERRVDEELARFDEG